MPKLIQNKYYTKTGEEKICSYFVSIAKPIVKEAGFDEKTQIKVRAENGKIIIENGEKNEKR